MPNSVLFYYYALYAIAAAITAIAVIAWHRTMLNHNIAFDTEKRYSALFKDYLTLSMTAWLID
jgi:hypothetical protein